MRTIIEPFKIKAVEPIRMTNRTEREAKLHAAGWSWCDWPFRAGYTPKVTSTMWSRRSCRYGNGAPRFEAIAWSSRRTRCVTSRQDSRPWTPSPAHHRSSLSVNPVIPGPTRSPSPPLTLVAVGCGRVFERFHLPALRRLPHWSLAAVVDTDPARLHWLATRVPGVPTGPSLARFLTDLRPDAVLITTSPESHFAVALEALRGGAHVLIEKPMVLLPSEADSLLDLARSLGREIRVGFNRRFRPGYQRIRELLAGHPENRVRSAKFELCSDPVAWQSCSSGLENDDAATGLLHDLASHQLDLLPWMLGGKVVEVRASYLEHTANRTLIAIDLRFAGGLVASCLTGHQPRYVERLEVGVADGLWMAGPGGIATAGVIPPSLTRHYLEARSAFRALARRLVGRPSDTLETFRRQFLDWARALRADGGGEQSASGADGAAGARSVGLIHACRRSLTLDGGWVGTQAADLVAPT
jgi:predicted dehydrogenase